MTQLSTKIKLYANREIDFLKDVRLQDNSDGKGAFIAEWNLDIPKPTMAQLDAMEALIPAYEFKIAIKQLREKRNQLLKDCDYTVLPDSVLTPAKKTEWMNYRTALRNLPEGLKTLEQVQNVFFPIIPQK